MQTRNERLCGAFVCGVLCLLVMAGGITRFVAAYDDWFEGSCNATGALELAVLQHAKGDRVFHYRVDLPVIVIGYRTDEGEVRSDDGHPFASVTAHGEYGHIDGTTLRSDVCLG